MTSWRNTSGAFALLQCACKNCSIKLQCTPGSERRITRWEHEDLSTPCGSGSMRTRSLCALRRETVEHPFGTMKARMGATHFLTKPLPKVAAEMALSILAYNLTRAMNIRISSGSGHLSPRSRPDAGPVLASRLPAL
ncbi:transposase [Bradyrhizobium jicamae]|nr:transposase [Bradyrhizobium jicamae]